MLSTVAANGEATRQIVEVIQNSYEMLSSLSDVVRTNSAYIARATEAQENSSETVAQAIAGLNQMRIEITSGIESVLEKLKQIQGYAGSIEQSAGRLVAHNDEQKEALESATQVMRAQQKAVMEGMRDLTEARVSIVSAVRAAQKVSEVPPTKG